MLDAQTFGLHAGLRHFTNVLFHALAFPFRSPELRDSIDRLKRER